MDPAILSIVIAVVAVLLAALIWLRSFGQDKAEGAGQRRPHPAVAAGDGGGVERVGGARGRRGAGGRMRRVAAAERADSDVEEEAGAGGAGRPQQEQLDELEEAGVKVPEGKIGKKKLEKLQAKADKKLAREAEEREREEAKKRQAEKDEKDAVRRQKEVADEEAAKERERKEREEKERREYEEYLKMKEAFAVEEEGFDEEDAEGDKAENKLQQFVDYVKANKVVVLEDLAAHFKMRTQDAIDRVTALQEEGRLTGVVDDRGKFIYISPAELEAVAKFIRQRGRVSIAELAESSNKLINLTPELITS